MLAVDLQIRDRLADHLRRIEEHLSADAVSIYGPITYGLDTVVRDVVERFGEGRKEHLVVVLETFGGIVEIVEGIVRCLRRFYPDFVAFVVPDRAMSAGTILTLSGDRVYMDYSSSLGPIDPQVERDGKLVPALSYLEQYKRLREASRDGRLTEADAVLLSKLDLAELHQYEQAAALSIELLEDWLARYKFREWTRRETTEVPVGEKERRERAKEIATALNDVNRWKSHARGISMECLRSELRLRINDLEEDPTLRAEIRQYHDLLTDYMRRSGLTRFVHARHYF